MLFNCCAKLRCRIVVLGYDKEGKTTVYNRLTKEDTRVNDASTNHLEKSVKLYGNLNVSLCNLSENVNAKSIWWANLKNTDGIIYVINTENPTEVQNSVKTFKEIMDQFSSREIDVLVLCNGQDDLECPLFDFGQYTHIKIQQCDINQWINVEEGIKWLCHRIKNRALEN